MYLYCRHRLRVRREADGFVVKVGIGSRMLCRTCEEGCGVEATPENLGWQSANVALSFNVQIVEMDFGVSVCLGKAHPSHLTWQNFPKLFVSNDVSEGNNPRNEFVEVSSSSVYSLKARILYCTPWLSWILGQYAKALALLYNLAIMQQYITIINVPYIIFGPIYALREHPGKPDPEASFPALSLFTALEQALVDSIEIE